MRHLFTSHLAIAPLPFPYFWKYKYKFIQINQNQTQLNFDIVHALSGKKTPSKMDVALWCHIVGWIGLEQYFWKVGGQHYSQKKNILQIDLPVIWNNKKEKILQLWIQQLLAGVPRAQL